MSIKFVGWFWNNTNKELGIERIHLKDWDPQQLAYLTVLPGQMVSFTSDGLAPNGDLSWIQAQILETGTWNKISLWRKPQSPQGFSFTEAILDAAPSCGVKLQHNDNKRENEASGRSESNTFSFTIWQNILAAGPENKASVGLLPNTAPPPNN